MEARDVELAQAGLHEAEAALTPQFDFIRNQVCVELANAEPAEDELRLATEKQHNLRLIDDFIFKLPHTRLENVGALSPLDVGPIRAHTLWDGVADLMHPRYIIGQRLVPDVNYKRDSQVIPAVDVLCIDHNFGRRGRLSMLRTWFDQFEFARETMSARMYNPVGTLPTDHAFGQEELVVTVPDTLLFVSKYPGVVLRGKRLERQLARPPKYKEMSKQLAKHGLTASFPPNSYKEGISNQDMRDFDVLRHLGVLAIAFQQSETYTAILQKHNELT